VTIISSLDIQRINEKSSPLSGKYKCPQNKRKINSILLP
jgi:hypothetical protein